MALTAPRAKTGAAAALLRAAVCDDPDTGVLIVEQNGRAAGDVIEMTELVFAMAGLSVRVLLAANGGNVAKSLAVVDQWIAEYGRQAEVPR